MKELLIKIPIYSSVCHSPAVILKPKEKKKETYNLDQQGGRVLLKILHRDA